MSLYMSTANTSSQASHEEMEDKSTDSTENKETTTATPTSKCNQWSKNEIVLVNLPTSNSFAPLQDPPEKKHRTNQRAINSQHSPNSNATNNSSWSTNNSNDVNFLCHCNRTFLDMDQMFPSNQEVKYIKLHWLNMLDPTCKVKFTVFPKCSF